MTVFVIGLHDFLLDSRFEKIGFEGHFGRRVLQVRFGFDSGSKAHIRVRFGFENFGFDTALDTNEDKTMTIMIKSIKISTKLRSIAI